MIAIIGGGIAGLIAAINLEKAGHECIIFEKQSHYGGRIATKVIDGIPLDIGFQVLLTDYPMAHKYLDYSELDLQPFSSGAVIFKDGKSTKFGDPLKNVNFLFPMLFSWAATINDKILVYKLSKVLRIKSIDAIFESSETSTLDYLQKFGFSDKIINNFFRPFFGGIFLEEELKTSSRMFEFVFKMFGEGSAAIPSKGMEAIPKQLRKSLKKTKIALSTEANINENGTVEVDGKEIKVKGIVKAYAENEIWQGCTTNYYRVSKRILNGKIIGLLADKNTMINSFYYVNDEIISVTSLEVFKPEIMDSKMRDEMKNKLGITPIDLIASFEVPNSLPVLNSLSQEDRSNFKLINNIPFVEAGDHLYYGSLNAAIHGGEVAANTLMDHLE
ncbi:FAD-dependent oxidoreductase [Portibacter lacus]|uniref:Amine oxidase domain-containing protein n=1 Tax=Portibacter lacus TaxID=1099794 RepID=A0AA37SVR0_9BACT|nr:FAD-dependent oxidoreductase [Portibacter lacus]GLR20170.1 hypothetical protein GCM10007940_47860 [Portibacter lacus]